MCLHEDWNGSHHLSLILLQLIIILDFLYLLFISESAFILLPLFLTFFSAPYLQRAQLLYVTPLVKMSLKQ